ncbi:hypothetical protein EDB87DRAFT_1756197 [Lactarius vividus]|nr:hypothetical protein EDB87DRAFT_1756197 [Lactarius vividus]
MSNSSDFSSGVHEHLLAGLNLFNKALLKSEADIATALDVLEGTLDDYSTGPIIQFSLQPEHPYAFEFIISSVKDVTSEYILGFILDKFSSDISSFSSSLGYEIASRLSHSLSQLSYPSNKLPEGLDDHCRHTQMVPTILKDLCTLLQSSFFEAESSNRKTAQQSKTSRRKNTTRLPSRLHAEIEDRLLQALGSQVPETRESVEDIVQSTIDKQKGTLKFFFTLLRRLEIAELVRNSFFQGNIPQDSSPITGGDPLQADLYSPSVAGFGEWRILCSHAFISDMTRDNVLSKAVLGRLRELSLGCFSETNRKRLTRNSPIDIFRARLPGGERLVYLIDVVPEFGINYGIQVLRVLGIYTMDKLKRTDWEKIGRYRANKGREYIEKYGGIPSSLSHKITQSRCKARKSPGSFFYDPMTCGGTATQVATIATDPNPQEVKDVDEIRRLFDLEQYSILSQNVMRDVLKGHAYTHIFQVSWEEKEVVEFTKSSFVLGRSGTGKTTVIVFKIFGIERAWHNRGGVGPRPRQLFVTKSQLLADKVEHDYVNLLFSLSEDPDTPQYICDRVQLWKSRRRNNVLDPDDSQGMRDDLPEKFSKLQDDHFPLFITVDVLWSLLEADIEPTPSKGRYSRPQQRNDKWLGHTDLVTFDVFRREYWRHLPQNLTKDIVPSVAFSDIIGIIKGSEKSLESPNHALDKGTYETLTNRNYALFEAYQRLKRERRQRDPADRTHDLLDAIKGKKLKGVLVDFVYVDEVQDLLLIDARLIVSLCRNPDGFLWAGDTAQTVSIGSAFSFKELGAFVYRYQRSIRAVRGTPSQPKGFQLLVNYRSHGGIVKCANAIIQLLQRFPGAIDVLQPEAGVAGEEIPVFFHSRCLPSRERDFFLLSTGRPCMLGSNQCIIVRDEAARQKLRSDIGRVGIVLTLFNSKGLEYDDVILYNFFEESADANLWRHLTDAQPLPLEDSKHAPLIYELKCLYVAVTRAKHKLWIVDYSDVCLPIKWHLLGLGLVVEPPTARHPLETFADRSTSKEWSEAGKRLLNHGEFEEAAMAFENAGEVYWKAVAVACRRREVARDIPESATKRRREAFLAAAGAFEHCATMADNEEEEHSRYVAAARCYAEIKYHKEVVRTLKRADMYTEAASYCFDKNLLKDAVSLIKTFKVDQETTERIKQVARISYLEAKNLDDADELFDDEEEKMEFVVEHELGVARAIILGKQEKYGEAVRQHLEEGQELDALEMALDHIDDVTQDPEAFNAIVTKILWRYLSFGCRGWSENIGIPAFMIRKLLDTIPLRELRVREQKMLYLFRLIFLGELSTTSRKTLANHILRCDPLDPFDKGFKLLALDFYFDDMSTALDMSSQSGIVSSLHLFHEYSLLMRDAAFDRAPWNSLWLCTLFQIEKDGEDIRTKPGTFMCEGSLQSDSPRPERSSEYSGVSLSREKFSENLNRLLWEQLNARNSEKDRMSSHPSIFDPCIQLTLYGSCRLDHMASHHLDEGWFNRRVRFHLQQVMTLDNLHSFGRTEFPERVNKQRRLLGALENALNPLTYFSGSIASLNEDLIPEAAVGLVTVKRWAFDVLYTLDPSREKLQGAFLTNLYKAFTLARLQKEGRTVDNCLRRIPCAWKPEQKHPRLPVICYRPGHQFYTLGHFLAFMDGSGDLEQGTKFFGFMVRERLPVDLAVLCTIVERLFGLAVMTTRHRGLGSLHGVLLPRTWILALWDDFFRFKDKILAPLGDLFFATNKLLEDIFTGEYQSASMRESWNRTLPDLKNKALNFSKGIPPKYLQDLCVARTCFCLLGENFHLQRNNVVQVASSLRMVPSLESRAFHGRYINSRHWTGLAEALYQSTTSPLDCLVRLCHESSPISGPQIPGVGLVSFREMNTIPYLLRSHLKGHPITTIATHENTGGPHVAISGQVTDGIDGTSGHQRVEEAVEYSTDDAIDIGVGEGPESLDRSREASIIQKAVRRYLLESGEGSSDDKLKIGRDRLFKACKTSANAVHARYRKIYLGPLPHLLLCLELIISSARKSKATIKTRRAQKVALQELSDLILQQTQVNGILKEACGLQRRLEPGSSLHPKVDILDMWDAARDLEPLRSAVTKTRDLSRRLSEYLSEHDPEFPTDPKFPTKDFECAWNGIMPSKLRMRSHRLAPSIA